MFIPMKQKQYSDPQYYEYLNKADLYGIILTRYISHHAMWEAKEYAILEQKSIFYSTFTNIPTILKEAAREYIKIMKKCKKSEHVLHFFTKSRKGAEYDPHPFLSMFIKVI